MEYMYYCMYNSSFPCYVQVHVLMHTYSCSYQQVSPSCLLKKEIHNHSHCHHSFWSHDHPIWQARYTQTPHPLPTSPFTANAASKLKACWTQSHHHTCTAPSPCGHTCWTGRSCHRPHPRHTHHHNPPVSIQRSIAWTGWSCDGEATPNTHPQS